MALSIGNIVQFANSTDVPKKLVNLNLMQVLPVLSVSNTPAGLQSGVDQSTNQLVFPWYNPGQPGTGLGVDLIVNFGPGATGKTNAAAAYAAIVAAATSI
jgi:hypothetical protein